MAAGGGDSDDEEEEKKAAININDIWVYSIYMWDTPNNAILIENKKFNRKISSLYSN